MCSLFLPPPMEVMFLVRSVCLFVCLTVRRITRRLDPGLTGSPFLRITIRIREELPRCQHTHRTDSLQKSFTISIMLVFGGGLYFYSCTSFTVLTKAQNKQKFEQNFALRHWALCGRPRFCVEMKHFHVRTRVLLKAYVIWNSAIIEHPLISLYVMQAWPRTCVLTAMLAERRRS